MTLSTWFRGACVALALVGAAGGCGKKKKQEPAPQPVSAEPDPGNSRTPIEKARGVEGTLDQGAAKNDERLNKATE